MRLYSLLEIKAVDDDERVIEGIATTPKTDRVGDVVEPKGGEFTLPVPFLWQHRRDDPIGHVVRAEVTDQGIKVRIQVERDDEPGPLKDLLDKAWRSIKKGLVRGLSIGFLPIEYSEIKGTFGLRFLKWDWTELSAVTIPANSEATIQLVKSFDVGGSTAPGVPRPVPTPGASGPVKLLTTPPGARAMNATESIRSFEATRAAKTARMAEIQQKATDDGRSKDVAEQEEFDTLRDEVKSIDKELVDLRDMEALNKAAAKPVESEPTLKAAAAARGPEIIVRTERPLAPGIEFARFAMCLGAAKGDLATAHEIARARYPKNQRIVNTLKAAVAAGTTTDATWASPLVEYNQFAGDFVEFLRPQTILGRFGAGNIPSLRRIPFNVHVRGQTSGGTGYWVGQGKPKPVTKFAFNDAYHGFAKIAAISVLAEELVRFSNPGAEALVRDGLAGCLIERMDTDFIDPAVAAVANVSPASITNGVASIASSGDTADDVRADLLALWATAMAANLPATSAAYITTPQVGLSLGLMRNALGQQEFPGINMNGGILEGVPVITSNYVPAGTFILVFASEIWFSDDGLVTVDASREASLEMLDNPTNDSVTPTPTTVVSMFQTDSIALRAHRFINWSKRRSQAVAWLHAVSWGGAES